MATRYMAAMDHVDLHAEKVLRKYAQSRPLGEIGRRYHVTSSQSGLYMEGYEPQHGRPKSCVNRTSPGFVRPATRRHLPSRQASSAPPVRRARPLSEPPQRRHLPATPNINVSVRGQPAMGVSGDHRTEPAKRVTYWRRPKTTSQLKSPVAEFITVKVDPELLLSGRRRKEITSQIREQWNATNHDVSSGQFVRDPRQSSCLAGQGSPRTAGQWLTFGGTDSDTSGVVEAFATLSGGDVNYHIDGHSGSRVAQELQEGGQLRIGVNGELSKRAVEQERTDQGRKPNKENSTEEPPSRPVPLCWGDQLLEAETKIVRCRPPVVTPPKPNLCETHPVVFKKLIPDEFPRPKLAVTKRVNFLRPESGLPSRQSIVQTERQFNKPNLVDVNSRPPRSTSHETKKMESGVAVTVSDSTPDTSSSSKSDPRNSPTKLIPLTKTETKHARGTGGNVAPSKPGSPKRLLRVKPTPASLQAHKTPDPELCISVPNKTDPPSLRSSAKLSGVATPVKTGGPRTGNQIFQTEFIHFSTGLITPKQRQRPDLSASHLISEVNDYNRRDLTFDLSQSAARDVEEGEMCCDSDVYVNVQRTNTPVSPPSNGGPPSYNMDNNSKDIAFSIPTAVADKLGEISPPFYGSENASNVENENEQRQEKHSPSDGVQESNISCQAPHNTTDRQSGLIEEPDRQPSPLSDHSDYSSADSSALERSEDEQSVPRSSSTTIKTVRFQTGLPDESPRVGDLLSNSLFVESIGASSEVRRLRQQIKGDLQRQQEDTKNDIDYLRLRQSLNLQ